MFNWIKKCINSAKNPSYLKGYKRYFKADCFYAHDQQSIARGIAAGLAGSVIPGLQIFYAAILVLVLRGNLPVALVATLITNPFTVLPVTYFIYYIGTLILGNGNNEFVLKDFQWDFSSFHAFWSNLSAWILQFGKAFLIGMPIVSICLGLIGYFGTLLIWKLATLLLRKKSKK